MPYKNKKIVCVIPARGGSKGVPGKNIKLLNGKPLIAYAIEAARKSKYVDRVIVSTDYEEIAKVAKKYKAEVPFLRPAELATDTAPTLPVLQHVIKYLEEKESFFPDIHVLIQPTSPFVLSADVDAAIEQLVKTRTNSCVSICEISERPEWMYKLEGVKIKKFLKNPPKGTRRQDLPKVYRLNGAVYATKRDTIMKSGKITDSDNSSAIIMPRERSYDIDEPLDLKIADFLMKQYAKTDKNCQ